VRRSPRPCACVGPASESPSPEVATWPRKRRLAPALADDALERVQLAEEHGLRRRVRDAHAGARLADPAASYAAATVRASTSHGRGADLHAHAGHDGDDRRHPARASGGRLRLGHRRLALARWSRSGMGQSIDKPGRMREYVAILRAILAGEPPPTGQKWSDDSSLPALPLPDLRSYDAALSPAMLAAWPRGRRRRHALALQSRVHPGCRHPEGAPGVSAWARALEGLRVVGSPAPSAVVEERRARARRDAARLLTYSAQPSTARSSALGLRRGHRRLRRGRDRGDGEACRRDLRSLPPRAVRDRLAGGGPRRRGALTGAGADAPCVGPNRQDHFEATAAAADSPRVAALRVRLEGSP
jgi:hypothetical protein